MPDMGQWVELFKGLDVAVLVMMAAIAYALKRAQVVTDAQAIVVTLLLGAVWGIADSLKTYGVEGQTLGTFVGLLFKGVLMNGGGAYLVAQLVDVSLVKLGVTPVAPSIPPTPITPPAPPDNK